MTVILAFLALVALAAGLWLSQQHLASKPWLETGIAPWRGMARGRRRDSSPLPFSWRW